MRNLDEINRLLAATEGEFAKLNARRTELLLQITELQQEKAALFHTRETPLQPGELSSVTNQSAQEAKTASSAVYFGVGKMSIQNDLRV